MIPAHAKGISLRFKIRASAASQIMANGRSKDSMGATAQNYCLNWILEQPEFFNRKVNEFSSKQIRKGNAVERDALDFIGRMEYDGEFLEPNTDHFSNNFMSGTPDVIMDDHVIDNKSSWSVNSFPIFDQSPEMAYWWQGQVYMHLTERKKHRVIHTLMNTPENLIQSEAYKVARELGYAEPSEEILFQTRERMTYDNIPDARRIKIFEFDYDATQIAALEQRVEDCRDFIFNTLLKYDL